MWLTKVALGCGGTLVLAGGYAFHEGVMRISVDEHRAEGHHIHFYVPAALVPLAVHFVPQRQFTHAAPELGPWLPAIRKLTRELRKLPPADLVEVRNADEHVQIRVRDGKLLIDVDTRDETVHVACPLATIEDIAQQIAAKQPAA
jgi:hypothetical protein